NVGEAIDRITARLEAGKITIEEASELLNSFGQKSIDQYLDPVKFTDEDLRIAQEFLDKNRESIDTTESIKELVKEMAKGYNEGKNTVKEIVEAEEQRLEQLAKAA